MEPMDYQDYQWALEFDRRLSQPGALQSLSQLVIDELDVEEDSRLLDVGTGTGRLGIPLSQIMPQALVVGMDPGYGMLRVAKEKSSGIRNFHLVRAKAEALPFPPLAFHGACLMTSLHHFTQPEGALHELHRVLKAGGKQVSLDPLLLEDKDEVGKKLRETIREVFRMAHGPQFHFFTASELRELYEKAGFSIKSFEIYRFPFDQWGTDGIPMGPHWLQTYQELQLLGAADLIQRFEDNYFSFRDEGGALRVKGKMSFAIVKATI